MPPDRSHTASWAQEVADLLGMRPAALRILAALRQTHPEPCDQGDLVTITGLPRSTLSAAIRDLESAGLVTGTPPRSQRHGHTTTWTLNAELLDHLLDELIQHLHTPSART